MQITGRKKEQTDMKNMKKTGWNIILKLIIAVASAVAGVIGGQAMTL